MESLDLQQLEWLFYGLLAAILVILVLLIGYVLIANRRQREKIAAAYEADMLAPRPALRVSGQILSLVRSEVGGALEVDVGGERYSSLADIEDPQLRREVVGSALELIRFTGALQQGELPPELAPLDATNHWREDLRDSSQAELERIYASTSGDGHKPGAARSPDQVEKQFLNLLAELGQTPPPPEPPTLASALRRRRLPKAPEHEGAPTFVDEIEAIVQRRLLSVPALVGRNLHVRLGDAGVVCFAFDGSEYVSLEDVPNLTAQQLIREAIAEWDERS